MKGEKKREEMKRAVRYKSGPGLMNTIYLGSMASAALHRRLGGQYGDGQSLDTLIDNASDAQFKKAWNYNGFQWILEHYRKAGSKLYHYETKAEEIE